MTITGMPVTVNIFKWLAEYAAYNSEWFDNSNANCILLKRFFSDSTFSSDLLADDEKELIYDFIRWLSVLILSFDGGLASANVRSFTSNQDDLSIVWQNDIAYSLSLTDWSRTTRRTIDYIIDRACSIQNYTSNISSNHESIFQLLSYYLEQLKSNYNFSSQSVDFASINAFILDDGLVFTILSAIPAQALQGFYVEFSDLFSDDLAVSGLQIPTSLKQFFLTPYIDDLLLLDKVKMHYNLQLFSGLNSDLLNQLSNKTREFLSRCFQDRELTDYIKEQLKQVNDMQLQPRIDLLVLINNKFFKD